MKSLLFRRVLTALVLCLLTALGFAAEPAAGCIGSIPCERVSVKVTDARSTVYYPLWEAPTATEPWYLVLPERPMAARAVAVENVNRQFRVPYADRSETNVLLAQIVLVPLGLGVVLLATRRWKPNVWQLLGVIAATTLIAAILFPVFAQSKSSAKAAPPIPIYEVPGTSSPTLTLDNTTPGGVLKALKKVGTELDPASVEEIQKAVSAGNTVVVATPSGVAKSSLSATGEMAIAIDYARPVHRVVLPSQRRPSRVRPVDVVVDSKQAMRATGSVALSVLRLRPDYRHKVIPVGRLITRSVGDGKTRSVGLEAFGTKGGSRRIVEEGLLSKESWLVSAAQMMLVAFFVALGLGRSRLSTPTVVTSVALFLAIGTGSLAMRNRAEYVPWLPGEMIQRDLPS